LLNFEVSLVLDPNVNSPERNVGGERSGEKKRRIYLSSIVGKDEPNPTMSTSDPC
jgi:hypothetical protein